MQDFFQPREVFAAVCLRNQNADADAHAGKKADKAVNRPRTGSDRRRGILSEQIADKHEVNGVVHLLNDTGAQQRQRKQQHGAGDGALRQINGFIFHKKQSPFWCMRQNKISVTESQSVLCKYCKIDCEASQEDTQ